MLLAALAAVLLSNAAPEPDAGSPPPDAAPAKAAATPSKPSKTGELTKETCQTKALSPGEKDSCCKRFPDICAPPPNN